MITTMWVTRYTVVQGKGGWGSEHLVGDNLPKELQGVEKQWQNVGNNPYLLHSFSFNHPGYLSLELSLGRFSACRPQQKKSVLPYTVPTFCMPLSQLPPSPSQPATIICLSLALFHLIFSLLELHFWHVARLPGPGPLACFLPDVPFFLPVCTIACYPPMA